MPLRYRNGQVSTSQPSLNEYNIFNLSGLNMYSPDETGPDNKTPYARNFRVFAPTELGKRVAISKRKGHISYSIPRGETIDQSITSTTGAADKSVTKTTWQAQSFVSGSSNRLTKVELYVKNDASGTGPLIVEIRSDSSGAPSTTVLATSSISNASITSSYAYVAANFIQAPYLTSGTTYWIVAYLQTDGTNNYKWSSTTSATTADTSTTSGNSWSSTSYAHNYKTYLSTSGGIKGLTRFYRSNGAPEQIFAARGSLFSVNDANGTTNVLITGLTQDADNYDFASVNDKLYFVNDRDAPRVYNGTSVSTWSGSPPVSGSIELHKNRLFLQSSVEKNKYIFSDPGDYETFGSTSYIYVPSPKTADPCIKCVSFQDNLVIFTRNTKFILYGSDLASFTLKEAPAKKGATSPTAIVTDGSMLYFMSDDGVYEYNGGTDNLISRDVEPIIADIADKTKVDMSIYNKKLYVYFRSGGQGYNNNCLIYDLVFRTWMLDTDVYVENSCVWSSQNDENRLIVGSSLTSTLFIADEGYSDVGKPIDFEYRTKYFSFGHPSAKHRIKRYYPHLRGQGTAMYVDCQVDVDELNSPSSNLVSVDASVNKWGDGSTWGGGDTWGSTAITPSRITIGGQNRKHQFRFVQTGVDNPVDILGMTLYVKQRRPI